MIMTSGSHHGIRLEFKLETTPFWAVCQGAGPGWFPTSEFGVWSTPTISRSPFQSVSWHAALMHPRCWSYPLSPSICGSVSNVTHNWLGDYPKILHSWSGCLPGVEQSLEQLANHRLPYHLYYHWSSSSSGPTIKRSFKHHAANKSSRSHYHKPGQDLITISNLYCNHVLNHL